MRYLLVWSLFLTFVFGACKKRAPEFEQDDVTQIVHHGEMKSQYITTRNVEVWLPSDYDENKRYAVLYMHDGQMLFDSKITWNNQEWQVDETITHLLEKQQIKDCIVVGIASKSQTRWRDYIPQKPLTYLSDSIYKRLYDEELSGEPKADNYLLFLTKELKPFIDEQYATNADRQNTIVMGSSMGGLISMYAICEYPDVFGGAGCISTHWPGEDPEVATAKFLKPFKQYMVEHLPHPDNHRIYFDYGDQTLDQYYKPYQLEVDEIMEQKGYNSDNWLTMEFPGHDHSERSWAKRLHFPLMFLLPKENTK